MVSLLTVAMGIVNDPSAGAATTHNVSMINFAFSPRTITVEPGDTVTWTNTTGITHTVTADDGSFDSGSVPPGQTFSHTFSTAGTVAYHCSIHGAAGGIGMAGTIVVQSASPATTAAPVTTPATAPPAATTPTTAAAAPGVVVAPAPSTAPPPGPAPGGAGADAPATAAQPRLARTGSNATTLLLAAAVLFVAGAIALVATRRRSGVDASG